MIITFRETATFNWYTLYTQLSAQHIIKKHFDVNSGEVMALMSHNLP